MRLKKENRILLGSIVVSIIVAALLFASLVTLAPDSTAFSVNNYGWNGMQQVSAKYSFHEINSPSAAASASNRSVLLEVSPATPFSNSEIETVRAFLGGGGTLVVADSSTVANSLLEGVGSKITVAGDSVRDPVYNWKQGPLPVAIVSGSGRDPLVYGVSGLDLSNASSLVVTQANGPIVIAESSPESQALNSSSGTLISRGPFVVGALEYLGGGKVVVLGDSTFFLNSVWTRADNQVFINNLLSNSTVYLDTSNWPINSGTSVKAGIASLYSLLLSYRYLSALGFIAVAFFAIDVLADVRRARAPPRETEGTFNSPFLERVRKDRERYGTRTTTAQ